MQKESWNIHLTKGYLQNEASAHEIATCKQNVGQKDFMHSNFQMNISLPWIDAAFTYHLKLYLNIFIFHLR
jgi:hypothetical protein